MLPENGNVAVRAINHIKSDYPTMFYNHPAHFFKNLTIKKLHNIMTMQFT